MSRRLVAGFDYRTGQPAAQTMAEWRDAVTQAMRNGMWRRVDAGETFIHCGATLQYEIYANVQPRGH